MADQKEPKKETVRITLPPRPAGQPAAAATPGRETVRINLPARPPASDTTNPARPPMAQPPLPPAPSKAVAPPPLFRKPPVPPSAATSSPSSGSGPLMPGPAPVLPVAATAAPNIASSAGPKKETARISVLPDVPARPAPTVEMKKTQPLITMPEAIPQSAPISVNLPAAPAPTFVSELPMAFCWALLVVSAAILTIQIWNYLS